MEGRPAGHGLDEADVDRIWPPTGRKRPYVAWTSSPAGDRVDEMLILLIRHDEHYFRK